MLQALCGEKLHPWFFHLPLFAASRLLGWLFLASCKSKDNVLAAEPTWRPHPRPTCLHTDGQMAAQRLGSDGGTREPQAASSPVYKVTWVKAVLDRKGLHGSGRQFGWCRRLGGAGLFSRVLERWEIEKSHV